MMAGRLVLVVGPSGAGKDTLLAGAVAADPQLHWARRVITRPVEAGGEPFESADEVHFAIRRDRGDFALHWQAHGLHYGVPVTELAALREGRNVLVNGSRGAIAAARAAFPDLTLLHITAPIPVLAARLAARGRETAAEIEARLIRADLGLPADTQCLEVANDASPAEGLDRLLQALKAARCSR